MAFGGAAATSTAAAHAGHRRGVASAVAVGGSAADAQEAMIKQAAALRAKYRRPNKIRIPVEQLGFHPCNRDGQPPNGQRCMELFSRILNNGYDVEEADAGGVAVAVKPGCRQIEAFNIEACDGERSVLGPKPHSNYAIVRSRSINGGVLLFS